MVEWTQTATKKIQDVDDKQQLKNIVQTYQENPQQIRVLDQRLPSKTKNVSKEVN